MNEEKLYKCIYDILENESSEIEKLTGEGIFYAPELYIAFLLGKKIKINEFEIFNEETNWVREINLGNGGPTDLCIFTQNKFYAFEFKIRATIDSYSRDIEKLIKLKNYHDKVIEKYFIALVDSFDSEDIKDERILDLEKRYPELKRVATFKNFKAIQKVFSSNPTYCKVAVWKIQ